MINGTCDARLFDKAVMDKSMDGIPLHLSIMH